MLTIKYQLCVVCCTLFAFQVDYGYEMKIHSHTPTARAQLHTCILSLWEVTTLANFALGTCCFFVNGISCSCSKCVGSQMFFIISVQVRNEFYSCKTYNNKTLCAASEWKDATHRNRQRQWNEMFVKRWWIREQKSERERTAMWAARRRQNKIVFTASPFSLSIRNIRLSGLKRLYT